MNDQPVLSEGEWALVVDLLEREKADLPAEIHHTRTATVRAELHERLDMVRRLLDRLHAPASV
jgi:predicted mannosyl-3-phosphoglycerate phosphatase (HAD superfamily)